MAITITQKPTTPNAAYTRLVYVVSGSTNTSSPQFSYVMDVFESGSSNRISRITQTVNPAGVAVFDPSRIIQGELSEDQSWKITNAQNFSNSSKKFTLQFGEQYGTSDSSSVTVYPNSTEDVLQTFRGVVEPNDGYYDWQSGSYAVLSNMPATMSMQQNDYGTIGLYNNSVEYVSQSFYSASFTGDKLVDTKIYNVTGDFVSIPISASTPYWNYVNVEVSSSIGLQNYRYEVSNETHREKVRFAFINKLGTWDYYNNLNPVRQTVEVNREQYTANRVDYSSLTSAYNIERRGLTDYHNTQDDSFTTQTDYLTKEDANWLEELLESPSVYIQRNNEFIPIVILNASYTANTSQARQKLFQYTIEFIPSNQPFGTWNPEFVECPRKTIEAPTVITLAATDEDCSSAVLNGSIISNNGGTIVEKGFVYNDSGSTTPVIGGGGVTNIIVPGSETGGYSGNTLTLTTSSYYQYRAYASNSADITYGDTVFFNTLAGYSVITNNITDVQDFSLTLNGQITGTDCSPIVERGFVYSTSSATPIISDTKQTVAGTTGSYSYTITPASSSTTYYARAYASTSLGIDYGDVKSATTLAYQFDPTLGSTIEPYYWYDFTDTGSMILSASSGDIYAIQSKGSNTGYLAKGTDSIEGFSGSYWVAPYTQSGYAYFNDQSKWNLRTAHPTETEYNPNSRLSRLFDTGSSAPYPPDSILSLTGSGGSNDNAMFNVSQSFTVIHFAKPFFAYDTFGGTIVDSRYRNIDFSPNTNMPANQNGGVTPYYQQHPNYFDTPDGTYTYISTTSGSGNAVSASGQAFNDASNDIGYDFTLALYNYSGSGGVWESRYMRYDSGSWKMGREPNSAQVFTTSSQMIDTAIGDRQYYLNLTIGGMSDRRNGTHIAGAFYLSHFVAYTQSLSDDQIQNVINSYTQSVSSRGDLTINTVTN